MQHQSSGYISTNQQKTTPQHPNRPSQCSPKQSQNRLMRQDDVRSLGWAARERRAGSGDINFIPSSMRRSYRPLPRPEKEFIHTYHINEVPLPYYNPLEDPHLSAFFANRKVRGLIHQRGLLYEPRQEYPYQNRRSKNAYKFHRDNSVDPPLSSRLSAPSERAHSLLFGSRRDPEEDLYRSGPLSPLSPASPASPQLKKRAESDILHPNKIPSLSEILSRRPSTQAQRRRVIVSSEGKTRIFQGKSFSQSKVERKNPERD